MVIRNTSGFVWAVARGSKESSMKPQTASELRNGLHKQAMIDRPRAYMVRELCRVILMPSQLLQPFCFGLFASRVAFAMQACVCNCQQAVRVDGLRRKLFGFLQNRQRLLRFLL